jgi:arsenate reductase
MAKRFCPERAICPPARPVGAFVAPWRPRYDSAMTITLYGIPNCDTVKKARAWLDQRGIDYAFHDYKKQGADVARIGRWIADAGRERIVNKAGTTYRKLDEREKQGLEGEEAPLILAVHSSVIKRPVVEYPGGLLVGFKPDQWEQALG